MLDIAPGQFIGDLDQLLGTWLIGRRHRRRDRRGPCGQLPRRCIAPTAPCP
ncbi:Hypothetical protein CAP_5397 [Chondromyces apiculatus DSM 436]|uniref:Uncharacterized protein n=1 Tax=Chondromyces apiculatus DSM 436 TaxID=1192034 RepID=A0A017T4Y2_9BACT|nr:Hypothetical protein CAP_5397 [Chondromyces apiculatus DSM 436]